MDNVDTTLSFREFPNPKEKYKSNFHVKRRVIPHLQTIMRILTRCTSHTRIYTPFVKVNLIRKLEKSAHTPKHYTTSKIMRTLKIPTLEIPPPSPGTFREPLRDCPSSLFICIVPTYIFYLFLFEFRPLKRCIIV
jgi:hypothetical protein